MFEYRQTELAVSGNAEMLSTDDITGKKSMLSQAADIDTEVTGAMDAEDALVDVEILAGDRSVVRGRVGGGATAGNAVAPQTQFAWSFVVFAGEEISVFIRNTSTGTPRVHMVIERQAI